MKTVLAVIAVAVWCNAEEAKACKVGEKMLPTGQCVVKEPPPTTCKAGQKKLLSGKCADNPPPKKKATCSVEYPVGAEVYVDGISWGIAPLSKEITNPADYRLCM